ncbi:RNA methyltransferase [Longispora fulva]|uniref:TrmH family RNA methyltransferase n=1 Tax=Longispora fulva TaxID=619741 RepID=A0A8J7H552_9ACTN|nr:RNA methyltransferase [Longispora fulva]MBG6141868.1 TrmH family RNA methyltransferase [Longispora fulva]GIG58976.1 RNA methyltransferase [Longispora fulva]
MTRPGGVPFTERTPRVSAARKLLRRRFADSERRFLAEGPQAVREALTAGVVIELFGTASGLEKLEVPQGVRVSAVTDAGLASLTETVQPQGVVAVCSYVDVPLAAALDPAPRLVAVLAEIRDPGNAGTVLRTADAAGAGAVLFTDASVDPYNGKCVRSTAGSLFHVDVVRGCSPLEAVTASQAAGLQVFATTGYGAENLDDLADAGRLAAPTAWLFGSEAHGLPPELLEAADARVRVPVHGRAESLNLAAAAAVCLYASASHQRRKGAAT